MNKYHSFHLFRRLSRQLLHLPFFTAAYSPLHLQSHRSLTYSWSTVCADGDDKPGRAHGVQPLLHVFMGEGREEREGG